MTLPAYIPFLFLFCTLYILGVVYWILRSAKENLVSKQAIMISIGFVLWLVLQGLLSLKGIYSEDTSTIPPLIFLFGILPFVVLSVCLFFTQSGRRCIDSLSLKKLTYLHLVRIPIEFGLLWLFLHKTIPQILTFEGWNFDIIMGLTAPAIIYLGYVRNKLSIHLILIWNLVGIVLLSLIFALAVLSSPFPLQQLAFEQPNIALLYFPYSFLPTFIVPVVLLGHFITIRRFLKKENR